MDRLDAIAVFVAVVDTHSFSGAAKKLGRSPAAVTRAIASLETRLGTRLMHRTTRSVSPTEVGQQYYLSVRRLLDDYQQAELIAAGAQDALRGTLRVTAPVVLGRLHVLPVVAAYLGAHHEVDVQLSLSDHIINLVEEGIDVAVRIGALPDSTLVARHVGDVRSVVCASRRYLDVHGRPRHPADLARHAAVVSSVQPIDRWIFHAKGREITVSVRPHLAVTGAEAAMDAAAAGLGVARVLSYQLRARVAAGALESILDEWEDRVRPVQIVVPSGKLMAAKVRAFIDLAAKMLPARL
jgi:DNA-binding transcriptional LysR family regulator